PPTTPLAVSVCGPSLSAVVSMNAAPVGSAAALTDAISNDTELARPLIPAAASDAMPASTCPSRGAPMLRARAGVGGGLLPLFVHPASAIASAAPATISVAARERPRGTVGPAAGNRLRRLSTHHLRGRKRRPQGSPRRVMRVLH